MSIEWAVALCARHVRWSSRCVAETEVSVLAVENRPSRCPPSAAEPRHPPRLSALPSGVVPNTARAPQSFMPSARSECFPDMVRNVTDKAIPFSHPLSTISGLPAITLTVV